MSPIDDENPGEETRSLRDRVAAAANAAGALARTHLAIFGEELSLKAEFAGKGIAAAAAAGALAVGIVLLLAALLVAIFAALFHSWIWGIVATLVLYAAGAGVLGWLAWKSLSRVRPGTFPATAAELAKDVDAVRAAFASEEEPEPDEPVGVEPDSGQVEDLERRLRAGAE